uniref:CSON003550 protein n=1 Tax=Culicoides sonorensis TaxID=179676 RepID=A0A336L323_CULSO
MPIVLNSSVPLPNLKLYTSISVLLVSSCLYYAINVTSDPNWKLETNSTLFPQRNGVSGGVGGMTDSSLDEILSMQDEINEKETILENFNNLQETILAAIKATNRDEEVDVEALEHEIHRTSPESHHLHPVQHTQQHVAHGTSTDRSLKGRFKDIFAFMLQEPICIWTMINMAYCCLILLGKSIQKLVFGELRISEQQVVLWVSWFSVLGFLHLMSQLCKDRSEYLTFSPTSPGWSHFRLVGLLSAILTISGVMMVIAFCVGLFAGVNTFCFMAAEVVLLTIKTLHVLIRYGIFLYDMRQGGINNESSSWDKRGPISYYIELSFEIGVLVIDLLHHLHMLIWSNIFLSMASLVIVMQLRYLTNEIQRKIKKHRNYLLVLNHMEKSYPPATAEDLSQNSDNCAICWEKMESARKLPCSHLFHNSCLQSWLEQDASCPTCRCSLSIHSYSSQHVHANEIRIDEPENNQRTGNNHFFHFNGSRYVSWLPNFSVEVTHINDILRRNPVEQTQNHTSQVRNMARVVQEMFPRIPLSTIIADLQISHSIEATIDNILEGRVQLPSRFQDNMFDGDRNDMIGAGEGPSTSRATADDASPYPVRSASDYYVSPNLDYSPLASNLTSSSGNSSSGNSSPTSTTSSSGYEVERNNSIFGNQNDLLREESFEDVSTSEKFSRSSEERERILQKRKDQLLVNARKRYLEKHTDDTQSEILSINNSTSSNSSENDLRNRTSNIEIQ